MKVASKIIEVLPIFRSAWKKKNRAKDSEDRLAKRISDTVSISLDAETIDLPIYNRFGKTTQAYDDR